MIKIWNRQNRYVKYLLYIYNLWGNTNRLSNKNIHKLLNINCYYPYHICKIANFNNSKPLSETSWVKGKCDLAFDTEHQKWRLATQILKSEVCGGIFMQKRVFSLEISF